MSDTFVLNAEVREAQGKGASRRLRRAGRVPGIVYGARRDAQAISVPFNELKSSLEYEAFFSHILTLKLGGKEEQVVIKDLQRHPAKQEIWHIDLLRVVADEPIRVNVPLHFIGEEEAPGVKIDGGVIDHHRNEIELECLPGDLPEFVEVDISKLGLDESIHLSELTLPGRVTSIDLEHENDIALVSILAPRVEAEIEEEEAAAAEEEAAAAEEEREEETGEEGEESEDKEG